MAKQMVAAMCLKRTLDLEPTYVNGIETNIKVRLPDGCIGILTVFESKKAAREYWGKDVKLLPIRIDEDA